jgi:hypothetical protein
MANSFYYEGILYQNGTFSLPLSAKFESSIDLIQSRNTSLLVPEMYWRKYCKRNHNTNIILKHLLEESTSTLFFGALLEKKHTIAKSYQDKGQTLIKVSCRVEESLIIEIEALAQYFRVSRCKLVSMMFALKSLGWLKLMRLYGIVRGTTKPNKYSITLSIFPRNFPKPTFAVEIIEIPREGPFFRF